MFYRSGAPSVSRCENRVLTLAAVHTLPGWSRAQFTGYVMIHGVAAGMVKAVCSWCQLLPLLMLELSYLSVVPYLPLRSCQLVELQMVEQSGWVPNPSGNGTQGEGEGIGGFCYSGPEMLSRNYY